MANSLLDFVLALVRDTDAAARYAADPAAALAAADLPGITTADVDNLIPVVADSLAAATPGFAAPVDPGAGNVWTTGAAAAAFDSFDMGPTRGDGSSGPVLSLPGPTVPEVPAGDPGAEGAALPDGLDQGLASVPQPFEPVGADWADDAGWPQSESQPGSPTDPQPGTGDPSGFALS